MIRILLFILLIYVCTCAYLFIAQRSFIYFPTPETNHAYSETSFNFNDATIKTVTLNKESRTAILYFGGNAEAVEYSAPTFDQLFPKQAIFLVQYRGFGGSTGKPSEEKIYSDAIKIFDELEKKYSKISVIGRSLGSGVATYVAAQRPVDKLILVTPYDSIESVAKKTFPIFPISFLLKDKYDSISRAKSISASTLLLVAENDDVIAKSHSQNLLKAFKQQKAKMTIINDTGHNSISSSRLYSEAISQFINSGTH